MPSGDFFLQPMYFGKLRFPSDQHEFILQFITINFPLKAIKKSTTGNMKVPPNQAEEQIVNDAVDGNNVDSDDGLNDAPHSPSREGDFSEYMWMENEEEFEEQIMQQLEEEALVQQCIDDVCAEMDAYIASIGNETTNQNGNATHNGSAEDALIQELQSLTVDDNAAESSKLNPDAAEFVPRFGSSVPPAVSNEDKL